MPLRLRNTESIPTSEVELVEVVGLKIPKYPYLLNGENAEVMGFEEAQERGELGSVQYFLKLFCMFTHYRLPRRERVTYEQLTKRRLHPDDLAEIMAAVTELLGAVKGPEPDEGEAGEKKAEESASSSS